MASKVPIMLLLLAALVAADAAATASESCRKREPVAVVDDANKDRKQLATAIEYGAKENHVQGAGTKDKKMLATDIKKHKDQTVAAAGTKDRKMLATAIESVAKENRVNDLSRRDRKLMNSGSVAAVFPSSHVGAIVGGSTAKTVDIGAVGTAPNTVTLP